MAVSWGNYGEFQKVLDSYLPDRGEGDNKASQLVTAVNKLIYKWYNDGDIFDTTGNLKGWANDLSSYANWIYRYFPKTRRILDGIWDCESEGDYEDLLWRLSQYAFSKNLLADLEQQEKVGSVYDCEGPYEYREDDEEEDEDDDYYEEEEDEDDEYYSEDDDDDIESAVDINAAEEPKNEALDDAMRDLKDDFDFIIQGLEKLERSSAEDSRIGLEIAEKFSAKIQETIAEISERF